MKQINCTKKINNTITKLNNLRQKFLDWKLKLCKLKGKWKNDKN